MRHFDIAELEEQIAGSGLSHLEVVPFNVPVSGDDSLRMGGFLCHRKDNRATYYYKEKVGKKRIVLHFTAGNLRGDLITLTGEQHVSVAFVIARSGAVYQLFDPEFWSYHLGPGTLGGNKAQSSATIAIELSNYGPLLKNGSRLETIYSKVSRPDIYCDLDDVAQYGEISNGFRDYGFFASYTDAQYDALVILLRHLTHSFEIARAFLPESMRYMATEDVLEFDGIVSHVNYRRWGKWDIGPAFDWNRVIHDVQAEFFEPVSAVERQIAARLDEIRGLRKQMSGIEARIVTLENEIMSLRDQGTPRETLIPGTLLDTRSISSVYAGDLDFKTDLDESLIEPGYDPSTLRPGD